MPSYDTDVLVIGAGPTGLMLAHELAGRGVRVRIVDKNEDRAHESRALVLHARSLELLDRHSLADDLIAQGRTALAANAHTEGDAGFRVDLGDIGVDDSRFPFVLFISQAETEDALARALKGRGVEVARRTELTSFTHDADGVTAALAREGAAAETIRAKYMVGCDGSHSIVRKTLGFEFEGAPYEQEFFLADADVETSLAMPELHFFLVKRGLLAVFPFKEPGHVRIIGSRVGAQPTKHAPTLEEVQSFVDELATVKVTVKSTRWTANYRLHHRSVDRSRKGRVFIAGDAGHIHSPAGGQGMNTGLQDAANLAWKLADVLEGKGGEALLDSYAAERIPVAKWLVAYTDRLFSGAAVSNPILLWLRNNVLPRVVPALIETRERRRKAFRYASQLAISYKGSPIVGWVGDAAKDDVKPRPGERLPDAEVLFEGKRQWLSKITRGADWFALAFGDVPDAKVDMPVIRVTDASAFPRFHVKERAVLVVRPDRYVAVRADDGDVAAAVLRARELVA